jgi:hypothetical protein
LVDKVTVYVDTVESVADEQAVCLVRALEGATTIGHVFTAIVHKGGASVPVAIRVDRIWRYGREVDIVDSPHTARLELGGSGLTNLLSSCVLVIEANDVVGDGRNRQ